MTTVVSRLYADAKTADSVSKALRKNGHLDGNIDVISAGDSDRDALALRITEARVSGAAAARYAERLEGDRRLLVVRVPFMPLGAAKNAIETVDRFEFDRRGRRQAERVPARRALAKVFRSERPEGQPPVSDNQARFGAQDAPVTRP